MFHQIPLAFLHNVEAYRKFLLFMFHDFYVMIRKLEIILNRFSLFLCGHSGIEEARENDNKFISILKNEI